MRKQVKACHLTPTSVLVLVIAIALAAGAVAVPAGAQASTQRSHWCRGGDAPILASSATSCPFAGNIINEYVGTGESRYWHGRVYSSVTHRSYSVACNRSGSGRSWQQSVHCTGPSDIWTQFSADI